MKNQVKTILLSLPTLLCFFGCAEQRPEGMPALVPCSLEVRENGTPVEGVLVSFFNEDGSAPKWTIGGTTDQKGVFQVKTHGKYNGAPKGTYKIVLSKITSNAPEAPAQDASREEFDAFEKIMVSVKEEEMFPSEYTKSADTPLRFTIAKKGAREVFDIKTNQ